MIKGHGDDNYLFKVRLKANFSSNTWYRGTPEVLLNYLKNKIHLIQNYPEPDAHSLRKRIATFHGLSSGQVFVSNGSVDAFYQIAQVFKGSKSAIFIPSFPEYEDACRMFGHMVDFLSFDELDSANLGVYQTVWLGNPNNPNGALTGHSLLISLIQKNINTTFIVDEAYSDLAPGFETIIPALQDYGNLVVCRSLTKTFALPGLRLGYFISSKKYAGEFEKTLKPWAVNSLAIEAGKFIFENLQELIPDLAELTRLSQLLQQEINMLDNFEVYPSITCFFLVKMKTGDAGELKQFLLHKHQILIRDASNFKSLSAQFFRISVQCEADNQLLVSGLADWQNKSRQ
ncbi:MAG: aminotransferase class I/II-fold pyridoxal phosphate-dependent enzyme [Chlorobi bacterium]|nr:aminotransferase class I/II-fold pyridoxal phosphate-dependent enzyme [Chlorobiota bacterium]